MIGLWASINAFIRGCLHRTDRQRSRNEILKFSILIHLLPCLTCSINLYRQSLMIHLSQTLIIAQWGLATRSLRNSCRSRLPRSPSLGKHPIIFSQRRDLTSLFYHRKSTFVISVRPGTLSALLRRAKNKSRKMHLLGVLLVSRLFAIVLRHEILQWVCLGHGNVFRPYRRGNGERPKHKITRSSFLVLTHLSCL